MPLLHAARLSQLHRGCLSGVLAVTAGLLLSGSVVLGVENPAPAPAPAQGAPVAGAPATAGTAATGPTPAPRVLTLADSINIALENSRAVQGAAARYERAHARIGEAASANRLQARVNGTVTRVDQVSSISVGTQSIPTGKLYTGALQLALTQPIDVTGALRASRNIAELGALVSQLDVQRTRDQTVLDVKNAFYQVLRAQAALGVAQANAASLEAHLRQAESFFRAGTAAQYDVLRAQTQLANAQELVIASRNAVSLAKAALNNVMGIDVTTPIDVRSSEVVRPVRPDFRQSVATAYERRPEVQQARVGTELARRGVTLARTSGGPTLGLGFNLNYTPETTIFNNRTTQWNAVLSGSYPLLDGNLTRARIREAQADVRGAQVAESQTRETVALEVQQAIVSLTDAAERLSAATVNVSQATEALRLARVRYQEGVATPLEVTDAVAVLTQAESNEVNARYDYLLARARYERAVGAAAATP